MSWIVTNIFWILIVCGLLTCTMLMQAVAPKFAFRFMFAQDLPEGLAASVVRNWGTLIFAEGLMLIYCAWYPAARLPVLLFAIIGKLGFIVFVFARGKELRAARAFNAALVDIVMVILFAWYLTAAA